MSWWRKWAITAIQRCIWQNRPSKVEICFSFFSSTWLIPRLASVFTQHASAKQFQAFSLPFIWLQICLNYYGAVNKMLSLPFFWMFCSFVLFCFVIAYSFIANMGIPPSLIKISSQKYLFSSGSKALTLQTNGTLSLGKKDLLPLFFSVPRRFKLEIYWQFPIHRHEFEYFCLVLPFINPLLFQNHFWRSQQKDKWTPSSYLEAFKKGWQIEPGIY